MCGVCLTWAVRGLDPETTDEILPLYAAVSLLDHGDLDIPIRDTYHPDFYTQSPTGKTYPKFGPGQAIFLAPFAAIGRMLSEPEAAPEVRGRVIMDAALFFGSFAIPLIGVLAYGIWLNLGYASRVSAISAVLLMATSELLPYSRSLFGDVTCAGLAVGAFAALGAMKDRAGWPAFAAGLCLGVSVLVRPVTVLFLAPFVLYLLLSWKRRSAPPALLGRQLLTALIPFAMSCAALLLFNRHAYGSAFSTGYGSEMYLFDQPLSRGIPHLLVSLEKGFFIYSPSVLLSMLFWRKFHRTHPEESITAILFAVLYLVVYAGWYASSPGNELSYGQRFLLPALFFAYLALPECVQRLRRSVPGVLCGIFLLFSFAGQLTGCLQTGPVYRTWAAQFENPPAPLLGYLEMTIHDPSSIAIWWWQAGGAAVMGAVALLILFCYFAAQSARESDFL